MISVTERVLLASSLSALRRSIRRSLSPTARQPRRSLIAALPVYIVALREIRRGSAPPRLSSRRSAARAISRADRDAGSPSRQPSASSDRAVAGAALERLPRRLERASAARSPARSRNRPTCAPHQRLRLSRGDCRSQSPVLPVGDPASGRRPLGCHAARRRRLPASRVPARAPNTSPSSSELLARRLAPCTPVHATSPAANSPGIVVRPSRSVCTPPIT